MVAYILELVLQVCLYSSRYNIPVVIRSYMRYTRKSRSGHEIANWEVP